MDFPGKNTGVGNPFCPLGDLPDPEIKPGSPSLQGDAFSSEPPGIAKFRLILKKVGKTIRPFRYDLNQISYDYTGEVRNRFKGLDLTECLMNYGQRFMTLYRRQGSRPSPRRRNTKKQNGCLRSHISVNRREAKSKGGKERYTHLNAEFQRTARGDKKALLSDQCKEIEENNRIGKTRDLFKKIRDTKGTFHAKMGSIKDKNGMDLTEAEDIEKRWQEYTEELYKKDLHDPDNHDGMITQHSPRARHPGM